MNPSFHLPTAASARMNHGNANKMNNNPFVSSDQASYSLLQSMVAASLQKQQEVSSRSIFLQTNPFDSHSRTNFMSSSHENQNENTSGDLRNIFDEFPEDAFEPVPIGDTRNTRISPSIPPFNASILESVLDHALGVVHEPDHISKPVPMPAPAQVSNVRKEPPFSPPSTTSAPLPKKRRVSKNQEPRFRGYQETQWQEQFEELLKFKEAQGNCLVPHTYPENQILSRWVKRQRYQYKLKMSGKTSTMTDARIKQLEDIGFVWDSHATAWDNRLKELSDYREKHGDCNVPSNFPENPELATWIKCQRRQFKLFMAGNKNSSMTSDRIQALNALGFIWKVREDLPLPNMAHMF